MLKLACDKIEEIHISSQTIKLKRITKNQACLCPGTLTVFNTILKNLCFKFTYFAIFIFVLSF